MKVLDLFSGIGGFSLGLERAGMETVAFCEVDKKCREVLYKHWPDVKCYTDVKELTYEQLKADGIVPNVICGGFPCQDISVAGKGKGIKGQRSGLWSEFARLIRDARPEWAIIENVPPLRSKGLALVLQDLWEIGYDAEWHCIPAFAIGAPHQRDRIWIVAYPMQQHETQRGEREVVKGKGGVGRVESGRSQGDVERERSVRVAGSSSCKSLADSNDSRSRTSRCGDMPQDRKKVHEGQVRHPLPGSSGCCKALANSSSEGLQGSQFDRTHQSRLGERIKGSLGSITQRCSSLGTTFWEVEPPVGRVVDGLSGRVDRLKQLGNSVLPQIPESIGTAIMEYKNNGSNIF